MIAKVFEIFVSFMIDHFGGIQSKSFSLEDLLSSMVGHMRSLLGSVAFAFSGILIASAGFLAAYFNLLSQYDISGTININAVSMGGVVLVFVGLGLLATAIFWKRPTVSRAEALAPSVSPIEMALSTLILDFVKEREFSREFKREFKSESMSEVKISRKPSQQTAPFVKTTSPLRPVTANGAMFTDGTGVLS